jgi:hypothetical protein
MMVVRQLERGGGVSCRDARSVGIAGSSAGRGQQPPGADVEGRGEQGVLNPEDSCGEGRVTMPTAELRAYITG